MTVHHHNILISACLLGETVRYDGAHCLLANPIFQTWQKENRLITICPEMAGGLPSPRPPAEIFGGDAQAVWNEKAAVLDNQGQSVTQAFTIGAQKTLELARQHDIQVAVLKEKSPSCGVHRIYDGQFNGRVIQGMGITAALLSQHGIRVFSDKEIETAQSFLLELDGRPRTAIKAR